MARSSIDDEYHLRPSVFHSPILRERSLRCELIHKLSVTLDYRRIISSIDLRHSVATHHFFDQVSDALPALNRHCIAPSRPMQNGNTKAIYNRVRKEMLNDMQFLNLAYARAELAAWTGEFSQERPHSALGHATPAALTIQPNKQQAASSALMCNKAVKFQPSREKLGYKHFPTQEAAV